MRYRRSINRETIAIDGEIFSNDQETIAINREIFSGDQAPAWSLLQGSSSFLDVTGKPELPQLGFPSQSLATSDSPLATTMSKL
jgi:hypothetical protein